MHTRQKNHLHKPLVKFALIQNGVILPLRYLINRHETVLSFNMTKYSSRMKKVFTYSCFYSVDEFLAFQ